MTDATTIDTSRAPRQRRINQTGTFHVRERQTVGEVAETVYNENTPEMRHHIWDWNRDKVASPEDVVPAGTTLRLAEPGQASGGPPLHKLSSVSPADLRNSSENIGDGGFAEPPSPVNRAVTRDMTPGAGTQGATVAEGSDGAEAQSRQDRNAGRGRGPATTGATQNALESAAVENGTAGAPAEGSGDADFKA